MSTYCYIDSETREPKELIMTIKEKDEKEVIEGDERVIYLDKRRLIRDYYREKHELKTFPSNWPQNCQTLGVLPNQVEEAESHARDLGVPTQYDRETGACIFRDREHRRKFLKANKWRDRDGGYSD
jgi:hypothetical protein